jgi:hypothetical protein
MFDTVRRINLLAVFYFKNEISRIKKIIKALMSSSALLGTNGLSCGKFI